MTNPADQLNTSLAGRYAIERELGQGGMATVYLAQDIKHKRKVALKVLKPELGAVLGVACPCCSATWRTSRFCAFNRRPVCSKPRQCLSRGRREAGGAAPFAIDNMRP